VQTLWAFVDVARFAWKGRERLRAVSANHRLHVRRYSITETVKADTCGKIAPMIASFRFVAPIVLAVAMLSASSADAPDPKLHTVGIVHVGAMGQSDEAERFRMLLDEELRKVGFHLAEKPENADAILTGVLTVRVYADTSLARATVVLKTISGEKLWGGDFQPKAHLRGPNDTVKFRAQNIAKQLRKDWEKAGKLARK
jgi:hypothetical protein